MALVVFFTIILDICINTAQKSEEVQRLYFKRVGKGLHAAIDYIAVT